MNTLRLCRFEGLLHDAFSIALYNASNGKMADELERILKEAVVA
jgi:hypothetical protein